MRLYDSFTMLMHWHKHNARPEPDFSEALGKVLDYMNEKVTLRQMADFSEEKQYE